MKVNAKAKAQRKLLTPWKGLSLRLKATLLAIAVGTIPIAVVGTTVYIALKESSQKSVEKNEQLLAGEVQNHLNQYMWERYGDIQIMAGLSIFTDAKVRQSTTTEEKSRHIRAVF